MGKVKFKVSGGSEDINIAKFDQGIQFGDGTQQTTAAIQGIQGVQGVQGIANQGVQGITGSQGLMGSQGIQGADGSQGLIGSQGLQGAVGPVSSQNAHQSVNLATAAVLPNSPTYTAGSTDANGGTGIGATLVGTTNGQLVVDGVSVTTGQRILVKDQATTTHNGIYSVTAQGTAGSKWTLTRATDYDDSSNGEVEVGDYVYVISGNTNATKAFIEYNTGSLAGGLIKIGTDPILFTLTTGTGVQGATGATGAGGVISNYGSFYSTVDQNATTGGEAVRFDTTNIQNGVTLVTDGTHLTRLTAPVTGTYLIDFVGQLALTGPGNKQANFWLVKNGATQVSTAFDSVISSNSPTLTGWTWQVNATAGDYYEVFWNGDSTNLYLNAVSAASPVPQAAGAVIRMSQINYQGIQGTQGLTGNQGTVGAQGLTGTQGSTGAQGDIGSTGATGSTGAQGTTGTTGAQGAQGVTGTGYSGVTSTTTASAVYGPRVFSTSYTGAYAVGNRVRISNSSTQWLEGFITAVSANTSITVYVDFWPTSVTASSWTFSLVYNNYIAYVSDVLSVSTGSKNISSLSSGNSFVSGNRVRLTSSISGNTSWMEGTLGSMGTPTTLTIDTVNGSGSYSGWFVTLAALPGTQGTQGTTGTGTQGATGSQGIAGAGSQGTQGIQGLINTVVYDSDQGVLSQQIFS